MDRSRCSICGKLLSGALDTYGDPGWPLCFEDYFYPPDAEPERLPYQDEIDVALGALEELEVELSLMDDDERNSGYAQALSRDLEDVRDHLDNYQRWQKEAIESRRKFNQDRLAIWVKLATL